MNRVKNFGLLLFCFLLLNLWTKESFALDKICLVKGETFCPKFSPDGNRIAFINGSPEKNSLWLVNLDGTNKTLIASKVHSYNWGLMGKCIFVTTFLTGLMDESGKEIKWKLMRINLSDLEKQVIAEGTERTMDGPPISSTKENIFAFGTTNFKNGVGAERLTIMDDQNKVVKLFEKMGPFGTGGFCWSPDGKKIAFFNSISSLKIAWDETWEEIERRHAKGELSETDGVFYLLVLNLETGKVQKVKKIPTVLPDSFTFLQWSSNSEDVYFNEPWKKTKEYFVKQRIKIHNISYNSERVILELESKEEPILLSPNEKCVVLYSFEDSCLYLYDIALKQKTPLMQIENKLVITGYFHKPIDFSNEGGKLVVGTKDGLFLLKLNETANKD